MKMFLISDNWDTLIGMRLAGVQGIVIEQSDEFQHVLDKVLIAGDIGILLISEKFAGEYSQTIDDIKLGEGLPLVVEIPDRFGSKRGADFISSYIREAIGIKL